MSETTEVTFEDLFHVFYNTYKIIENEFDTSVASGNEDAAILMGPSMFVLINLADQTTKRMNDRDKVKAQFNDLISSMKQKLQDD